MLLLQTGFSGLLLIGLLGGLLGCTSGSNGSPTAAQSAPPTEEPVTTPAQPTVPDSSYLQFLQGRFDYQSRPDFVEIEAPYASRPGLYLQREAAAAFHQLARAADAAGFRLQVLSATRDFDHQRRIWERKWTGSRYGHIANPEERARAILSYSSMPGTSRHHWGTDLDLNSLQNRYFRSGQGLALYRWLRTHAADYGFGQPYTGKDSLRPYGYEEERWHWSYLPLARSYTRDYLQYLHDTDLMGFAGAETAPALEMVRHYVGGIHPDCQ